MILVFGGTTEGKIVAQCLNRAGLIYCYSTKTEISFEGSECAHYRFGAFDLQGLDTFCLENNVQLIVNASHPFASELHQTIHLISQSRRIKVLRYEREYAERVKNKLVTYLPSYESVLQYLEEKKIQSLLALSGVQSIKKLKPYWQNRPAIFRILPRESSLQMAQESGFPLKNLIAELPSSDIIHEISIIKKYAIDCILTKESGASGFLPTKIKAALKMQIPILILEKPSLPDSFICVSNEQDLIAHLSTSTA